MRYGFLMAVLVLAGLSGCGPSYSPDTYASNAAQQAAKVEQGVVVGVRNVAVSAAGTVGTVTGAAAGGIAGSQVGVGPVSAFTALGGSLVGGIGGSAVEHVTGDTTAYEYIVRKPNGDLVSVTQKDKTPLVLGQKVLVIAGTQARVVPDYTVAMPAPPTKVGDTGKAGEEPKAADTKPAEADQHAPNIGAADAKPADSERSTVGPYTALPPVTLPPAASQSAGSALPAGSGAASVPAGSSPSSGLPVPASTAVSPTVVPSGIASGAAPAHSPTP